MKIEDTSQLDPQLVQALSALPYGLYFLGTGTRDQPRGMLVSWVSQVGGDPPMLMVALRENRATLEDLIQSGAFALNLLPATDMDLVRNLARRGSARLDGIALEQGPLGLPVLVAGLGAICCKVIDSYRPGDHALVIGEINDVVWRGGGPVLTADQAGHAYLGLR